MTLEQELDEFAQRGGGQRTIRPRQGQDLEAFKATIASLERYANEGRLQIVREHQEQYTGNRDIDSVTIELTPEDWFERTE
jgi:hypothetical protein